MASPPASTGRHATRSLQVRRMRRLKGSGPIAGKEGVFHMVARLPRGLTASAFADHLPGGGVMQDEALDRIEGMCPGSLRQYADGVGIARGPARADAFGTEVDVLAMVLSRQRRGQQPHHMHAGGAAISRQLTHFRIVAQALRQPLPISSTVAKRLL